MTLLHAMMQKWLRRVRGWVAQPQDAMTASHPGAAPPLGPMTSSLVSYSHWPDAARHRND